MSGVLWMTWRGLGIVIVAFGACGAKPQLVAPATDLAWSADGQWLVAASRTGTLVLDPKGKVEARTSVGLRNVTLGEDGGQVIGVNDEEQLVVVDVDSGSTEVLPLSKRQGKPVRLFRSDYGDLAVTHTVAHHMIKVGDRAAEPTKNYEDLWLIPGAPLYGIDTGYGVQIRQMRTGRLVRHFEASAEGQRFVGGSLDADGRLVLGVREPDGFRIWTPPDDPSDLWPIDADAPVSLSGDGRFVAVGERGGVGLYASATGGRLDTLKTKDPVLAVAFSPDSARVAASLTGGGVEVFKVNEDAPEPVDRDTGAVDSGRVDLSLLPELAPQTRAPVKTLTLSGTTSRLGWAPGGRGLHGWVGDGLVRVDLDGGTESPVEVGVPRGKPFAWSPDGTRLALAAAMGVHVVDPEAGTVVATLDSGVEHGLIDWQGGVIVVDAGKGQARVWDPVTGEAAGKPFRVSNDLLVGFVLDPGGRWLAVRGTVPSVIDLATGEILRVLDAHTGGVSSIVWSPDGSLLATAGNDGVVLLWDTATWEPVRQLEGAHARQLVFSPNGRQLVSVTWVGGTVADVDTGQVLQRLTFDGLLASVSWSRDGLVIADNSGSVFVWR